MSLYVDMRMKIIRRHRAATVTAMGYGYHKSIYETSPLLRRLASESNYHPLTPASLDSLLESQAGQRRARQEERCRLRDRREELTVAADEAERALLEATPFTELGVIASARQRLDAAMYLLSLIPDSLNEEEQGEEADKEALLAGLDGWRERLQGEHGRIREEVDALERSGETVDLDSRDGKAAPLMDELDAVLRAVEDADKCQSIFKGGAKPNKPVWRYRTDPGSGRKASGESKGMRARNLFPHLLGTA
jgi:hypothetical protein